MAHSLDMNALFRVDGMIAVITGGGSGQSTVPPLTVRSVLIVSTLHGLTLLQVSD